jgi:hypothetical protein
MENNSSYWLLISLLILFCARVFKIIYDNYKKTKKIKEQFKELESNKCKGPHSWIDIEVMKEKTHVCSKCYWSPKHNTFVKKMFVDAEIQYKKFEEELEKYKQQRIEQLAAKYFMEPDDLKIVAEEILKIKKDFTTQYLDKKIKELRGQSLKEVKIEEF